MRRRLGGPPTELRVFASAKVNLGWQVGPRRADGYHDVTGLLHTISIVDRLVVRISAEADPVGQVVADVDGASVALTVEGPEAVDGLAGADNLVLRAAEVLARRTLPLPTSMHLHKDIPVAAGLGGGSADAAGALLGLAMAWGADLTAGDLVRLASDVGSDVPAILLGGLVHAAGRGERVRQVGGATGMRLVVGVPDAALSTAAVYRRLDELRPGAGAGPRAPFANDLEPAAVDLCPAVGRGLDALRAAGADLVFVSGSGPAVVAVMSEPASADEVAAAASSAFRRVIVADPTAVGVRMALGGPTSAPRPGQ